jgi:membrane-associated phospholipid phosphatase
MGSTSTPPDTVFPALRSWWWVPAAALVFAGAVAAGMAAKSLGLFAPELGVDMALSHGRNRALVVLSQAINYGIGPAGAVLLVLAICSYLLWVRGRPVQALAFGSVVAAGRLGSSAAKVLVGRSRPPAEAVGSLAAATGTNSFPSGHTAFAVALVLAIAVVLARSTAHRVVALTAGTLFVALVAFSRLYLGVHYPSDVAASVLISGSAILAWVPVWNNLVAPEFSRTVFVRRWEDRAPTRR